MNINDSEEIPLLHQAILRQCTDAALFLLDQNVDLNIRSTEDNLNALQLAVRRHLPLVVEHLCRHGANMSELDPEGNSPLWTALDTGQEEIATILVNNSCDSTQWSRGPEGCQQTLLHRAIDENNDAVAIFLIKSGCDVNSCRRPGLDGEMPEEAQDGSTPIHLASAWGLEKIVTALVDHNCELNAQVVKHFNSFLSTFNGHFYLDSINLKIEVIELFHELLVKILAESNKKRFVHKILFRKKFYYDVSVDQATIIK